MAVGNPPAEWSEVDDARRAERATDSSRVASVVESGTFPTTRSVRLLTVIVVIGVALTALATWAAARADDNAEQRLLDVQTKQAAAVLSTAIVVIQQPLTHLLDAERVVPRARAATTFQRLMGPDVGPGKAFLSASLWRAGSVQPQELASAGGSPALQPQAPAFRDLLADALASKTSVVRRVLVAGQYVIVYGYGDAHSGLVVYAERAIPKDRRAAVDRSSAFADINYAIYLGDTTNTAAMTTTNVDPASLPLHGVTSRTSVPFGDSVLTLTTSPRTHLGSPLSQRLPWILLAAGALLTLAGWTVARQLVRARNRAEADTATIAGLYQRVDTLYGEQRALAVRLQRALLPQANPEIPEMEVAADYVAGTQGVDIGGDWFSVIRVGEDHVAFVVGDVSGKGVDAVAVMARARFTLRAYLLDGDTPESALEKCSRQFDITTDGHIVTVVAGLADWRTGEIRLASAGHLPPLLLAGDTAEFLELPVGPPLGVGAAAYTPAVATLPPASTLFCYTDGLVERRTEDLASGMQRLVRVVEEAGSSPVREAVQRVLRSMHDPAASDDIALLALRRVSA